MLRELNHIPFLKLQPNDFEKFELEMAQLLNEFDHDEKSLNLHNLRQPILLKSQRSHFLDQPDYLKHFHHKTLQRNSLQKKI